MIEYVYILLGVIEKTMKTYLIVLFASLFISCSSNEGKLDLTNSQPLIPFDSIMQSMSSFEKYFGTVLLPDISSKNIVVYDSAGNRITTEQFVNQFGSGDYLPF